LTIVDSGLDFQIRGGLKISVISFNNAPAGVDGRAFLEQLRSDFASVEDDDRFASHVEVYDI
jgi:hypothetical protein